MLPEQVYLVMENTSNGADCWTTVLAVYADETAANLRVIELEEENPPSEYIGYYVESMALIQ